MEEGASIPERWAPGRHRPPPSAARRSAGRFDNIAPLPAFRTSAGSRLAPAVGLVAAVALALAAIAAAPGVAITQADLDGLRARIDAPGLAAGSGVAAAGLTLRVGPGTLALRNGRIYAALPVAFDPQPAPIAREYVFVGDGLLELDPHDPIESHQLEVFAGSPIIREPIRAAVLVIADDDTAASIAARPTAPTDPDATERARSLLANWRSSPERRILDVEEAILADVLGEPEAGGFFAGAFEGTTLKRFLLSVEPRATEQVSMGRFEPVELTAKERERIARMVHREQRRGRMLGFTEDTLGQFDSWLSMPLQHDGAPAEGRPSFEPEHYQIDAEIGSAGDALAGRARVRLRASASGSRVASFDLLSDLLVSSAYQVEDGALAPAPFVQVGDRASVVLDRAPRAGETVEVELRWAGQAFDSTPSGTGRSFHLRDSLLWYPHAGEEDLATYDVTLRWPKKWELLAVGTPAGEGIEGGLRWQRRLVDRPTLGYTFEFGRFETVETDVDGIRLRVAIDAASQRVLTGRQALLDAAADAVRFFTGVFGPLPLRELVVVTSQQDFSQSMLGFVVLSLEMTRDDKRYAEAGYDDPRTTIAHEISHQWWGHLVSWNGYRDQWLSEALADYSSAFYERERLGARAAVWAGPLTDWQDDLESTVSTGQTLESLGPVVLGERLDSSLSEDAYQSIVYTKGALVLNLLAQRVGLSTFHSVLRGLAQTAAGRPISTADFLRLVSDRSGVDLGSFADAFVYGTGIPELEYSYRWTKLADDRWRATLEVARVAPYRFTYQVAECRGGGLDVVRTIVTDPLPAATPALGVPFEVEAKERPGVARGGATAGRGAAHEASKTRGGATVNGAAAADTASVARGVVLLDGPRSTVELELPIEPARLTLDPDQILLGEFYDVTESDKVALERRGYRAWANDPAAAEALFRQAIAVPTAVDATPDDRAASAEDEITACLELARAALDRGDDAEAKRWIERAKTTLAHVASDYRRSLESDVAVVEARLDLRRGSARAVARRLMREWDEGWLQDGEGLLLLAIAAQRIGDGDLAGDAIDAARKRRVEITDLGSLLGHADRGTLGVTPAP